tara:strand:- start:459 stop:800 length:342 start_codon:yes stop_codon:yes gene_type:complete
MNIKKHTMGIKEYYEHHKSRKGRSYEMFSKGGDNKCHSITQSAIRKIAGQKRVTKEEILGLVSDKLNDTYRKGKHKEVWDSEPPRHIAHYINQALRAADYGFEIDAYEFNIEV